MAALGAMAGAAHAQSTVTIYGLLDANFGSRKTNSAQGTTVQSLTQTKIESGGLNGSRWGFRVIEDIGGGMAVTSNLESGFDIDTGKSGQGGRLFGRRANVGVAGGFGTLLLGRNNSSYDDVAGDHAMMDATDFDRSNTRPSFSASALYAFGEDKTASVGAVGGNDASKTVSANLKYANGPLLVSGGYQSETTAGSVTATTKPALQNTILSVAYDFGVAKVGVGFNRAKYKDVIVGGAPHELAAQKEYSLSVLVPLGATTLSAGYARSKGDDLGKSTGFGVQALYALSKRTTLYAGALNTKAYDTLATATLAALPGSTIGRTTTYAAGIRHKF